MANFQPGLKFQPGFWNNSSRNQIGDYMEKDLARAAIQPGLKNLKKPEKTHVIETEFQPGLKNRKKDGCRYDFSGIKAIKWRISLISKLR